jgi:hypothetical protein
MSYAELVCGIVGVIVAVFALTLFFKVYPQAKLRRRLRKTRNRIVSKSQSPSIKFSVKPPKE